MNLEGRTWFFIDRDMEPFGDGVLVLSMEWGDGVTDQRQLDVIREKLNIVWSDGARWALVYHNDVYTLCYPPSNKERNGVQVHVPKLAIEAMLTLGPDGAENIVWAKHINLN